MAKSLTNIYRRFFRLRRRVATLEAAVFPPDPPAIPLWTANHETGDASQWDRVTISGNAATQVTTTRPHTGTYSNELSVSGSGGVRMVVETTTASPTDSTHSENLPTDAYYSVWYNFPQKIDPYTNVFQWKQAFQDSPTHQTRKLLYFIRADWDTTVFRFHLRGKVGAGGTWESTPHSVAESTVEVPLNTWVHLECRYVWSQSGDGRITCWQDGTEIMDVAGIYTELDAPYLGKPRQWTVNNYSTNTSPSDHVLYVDDAAISLTRIGNG